MAFPQSLHDRSSEIEFPIPPSYHIKFWVLGFWVFILGLFKQERLALSMHGVLGVGGFCVFVYLWKSSIRFYFVEELELNGGFWICILGWIG